MNQKPKIAILSPYIGINKRGAETFTIELVQQLQKSFDVTVFSFGTDTLIKDNTVLIKRKKDFLLKLWQYFYLACEKVNAKRWPTIIDRLLQIPAKVILRTVRTVSYIHPTTIEQYFFSKDVFERYIQLENFALIFPNNGIWGVRFAAKLRQQKKIPFIYTGHGGIGNEEQKIIEQNPDIYIATNPTSEEWAKSLNKSTIIKIPIGINLSTFSKKYDLKPEHRYYDHPIVLCVAAFTEFKQQALLVNAMQELGKGTLILIGTGELIVDIENLCQQNIPGRYSIRQVPYQDIPYYYSICDVFTLPSRGESFGVVYIEALAANKPIVYPLDPARKELIGDAGIACDVTNASGYAKALEITALKDWKTIPYRQAENYSWNIIGKKYIEVINQVISRKN